MLTLLAAECTWKILINAEWFCSDCYYIHSWDIIINIGLLVQLNMQLVIWIWMQKWWLQLQCDSTEFPQFQSLCGCIVSQRFVEHWGCWLFNNSFLAIITLQSSVKHLSYITNKNNYKGYKQKFALIVLGQSSGRFDIPFSKMCSSEMTRYRKPVYCQVQQLFAWR